MRGSRTGGVALLVIAGLAGSAEAGVGEAQLALGGGAGAAFEPTPSGVAAGAADAWIGLGALPWLALSVGAAAPTDAAQPSTSVLAGGALALDVLRWVPWLEALAGVSVDADGLAPAARVGLGVDHVLDLTWSVGLFARADLGPARLGGPRVTGGLRLAFRLEI
jgi:hypothetical protein